MPALALLFLQNLPALIRSGQALAGYVQAVYESLSQTDEWTDEMDQHYQDQLSNLGNLTLPQNLHDDLRASIEDPSQSRDTIIADYQRQLQQQLQQITSLQSQVLQAKRELQVSAPVAEAPPASAPVIVLSDHSAPAAAESAPVEVAPQVHQDQSSNAP